MLDFDAGQTLLRALTSKGKNRHPGSVSGPIEEMAVDGSKSQMPGCSSEAAVVSGTAALTDLLCPTQRHHSVAELMIAGPLSSLRCSCRRFLIGYALP